MESLGVKRYRLIDEATAAALGNDVRVKSADPVMIFDFGGGTLDVAIVKIDLGSKDEKKCLVLGKGSNDIGGADIDQWLYLDLLDKNGLKSKEVKHISHIKGTRQSIGRQGEIIIHKDQDIKDGHFQVGELALRVDPPARKDEKFMKVNFMVDDNKRLCVTAFDLRTRRFICKKKPVVTLV